MREEGRREGGLEDKTLNRLSDNDCTGRAGGRALGRRCLSEFLGHVRCIGCSEGRNDDKETHTDPLGKGFFEDRRSECDHQERKKKENKIGENESDIVAAPILRPTITATEAELGEEGKSEELIVVVAANDVSSSSSSSSDFCFSSSSSSSPSLIIISYHGRTMSSPPPDHTLRRTRGGKSSPPFLLCRSRESYFNYFCGSKSPSFLFSVHPCTHTIDLPPPPLATCHFLIIFPSFLPLR